LSKVEAKIITDDEFNKTLKAFDDNPFIVRYTIVTGYGLMMKDAYISFAGKIQGDYWKLISTFNIEIEQLQGLPKEIFLWTKLPPLEGDKYEEPPAPMKVDIWESNSGLKIPTFIRSVDPRLPLTSQLEDFASEVQLFYTVNCRQEDMTTKR
jgi:hypothetical protein